jgi:hypothetical protein
MAEAALALRDPLALQRLDADSPTMQAMLGDTPHREFVRLERDEAPACARHVGAWALGRHAALS